jgi:signal transduction histidine kinase
MTANVEATMVALRGLLEGHHARLEAESMVGHGSAFRVRFPRA